MATVRRPITIRKLYYPQHGPRLFYQNVISGCIMSFAFGGDARLSSDVHVCRNILDASAVVADHGSPPWESMRWYHNTILANPRFILASRTSGRPWQVFNNLLLFGSRTEGKPQAGAAWGGNIATDPNFAEPGDFRLPPKSSAIDAGATIPNDWFDRLRGQEKGKPDAGAIPYGAERIKVGRHGRLMF